MIFVSFFQIHDFRVQLADELKSKDHIMRGVQTLQQQLTEANRKYQEDIEKMRNANMVHVYNFKLIMLCTFSQLLLKTVTCIYGLDLVH